jgi:hypothetical protein
MRKGWRPSMAQLARQACRRQRRPGLPSPPASTYALHDTSRGVIESPPPPPPPSPPPQEINRGVQVIECTQAAVDLDLILGQHAFDLERILAADPQFLTVSYRGGGGASA